MMTHSDQLELALGPQSSRRNRMPRRTPHYQSNWWFRQMRVAVDKTFEYPQPEQLPNVDLQVRVAG